MDFVNAQINSLEKRVKELDEFMFCLVSQKQINRAIEQRDMLEESIGNFRRIRKQLNRISHLNKCMCD